MIRYGSILGNPAGKEKSQRSKREVFFVYFQFKGWLEYPDPLLDQPTVKHTQLLTLLTPLPDASVSL